MVAPGTEEALEGLKIGALVRSAGWKVIGLASSPPVDFREERSLAIVLMPMSGAGGGGIGEEALAEKLGGIEETGEAMGGTCGAGVEGITGEIGFGAIAIGGIGGVDGGGGGGGSGGGCTGELSGILTGGTDGLYSLLPGKGAGPCKLSWLSFI